MIVCFFFSSRRRHTRYWRDWSSDVCSSDLTTSRAYVPASRVTGTVMTAESPPASRRVSASSGAGTRRVICAGCSSSRSVEGRVGEKGRSRWAPDHLKKKNQEILKLLHCYAT